MSTKKEYILDGLNCANCSAKIENYVSQLKEVEFATMNFATSKLTVGVLDNIDTEFVEKSIKKIVNDLEPDVIVHNNETYKKDIEKSYAVDKKKLILTILGSILYLTALLVDTTQFNEFVLFFTSYLLIGGDIILSAFKNVLKGQLFDENFLMTIATIGAFAINEYPEAVAVMLFFKIGEFFQDLAVERSRNSISELMDIRPDFANLKVGDVIDKVDPTTVKVGDIIIVKAGEKIPLDGVIISGESLIDTIALTGESALREAGVNDEVLSGSINKNGLLTIRVNKEFSESTVSKILELVQNASNNKAVTENFITKFARYYTPIVVGLAFLLAFLPPLVSDASISDCINRALVFLVVSCPCALVVSIPLGFFGGIGGASKSGILVKGGNYLEALNNVDTVVFDKTGTLTKGVFKVTEINSVSEITQDELLEYTVYAESFSNHPIANSIIKAYDKEINKNNIKEYNELEGFGIKANINGKEVLVGNQRLMLKENINLNKDYSDAIGTIVHVAVNNEYAGNIVINDEVKNDSKLAIASLKNNGVKKIVMLTGDTKKVGEKIASELGIDKVYTELLPHQKVEMLEQIEKEKTTKGNLVYVGDGINDAPVLARADIGIAMGGVGSDAAIEASDVVLMTDEPTKIVKAIKIAKRTRNIVWQNIIFAMGIKLIVLSMGAFGMATMWEAVFADVGVALLSVLNAMRIMNVEKL